jgi:hypothetical protein
MSGSVIPVETTLRLAVAGLGYGYGRRSQPSGLRTVRREETLMARFSQYNVQKVQLNQEGKNEYRKPV